MYIKKLDCYDLTIEEGRVAYTSPSNIALIKYWGKYGVQLPQNPSISITLDKAHTKMEVEFLKKETELDKVEIDFYFEGVANDKFAAKIQKYLDSIVVELPFLTHYSLKIHSENTFPHSSGIASSASSMSALAMCLCDIERVLLKDEVNELDYMKKASHLSRLGSGSACRSIIKEMGVWGECEVAESSNEYAVEFSDFHPIFKDIRDSVAIISSGEKAVSSRAGHALMNNHPFAQTRFESARDNLKTLLKALKEGDFDTFCEITEIEALELHGLMMNSRPSYILMRPNTLAAIERIRDFRKATGTKLCFTLDAGPNVHILFPKTEEEKVLKFIEEEIKPLTQTGLIIHDHMGLGANKLK